MPILLPFRLWQITDELLAGCVGGGSWALIVGGHEEEGRAEYEKGCDEPDEVEENEGLLLVTPATAHALDQSEEPVLLVFVHHYIINGTAISQN